ncbi:serine/threonine-protein kinase [Gemmata obscuriglobus]|nr:serine/threonine-protein kinase [Gemmata obscuriglobus]
MGPHDLPTVPGYTTRRRLGGGGMGVVYEAVAVDLKRSVALKVLREELLGRPDARSRFRDEAEAIARLSHPNVVQIYEVGVHDGRPFLAMEFVPGGSLADQLDAGPLPVAAAVDLVRTLARGVQHAHDRGVIHRDLKPANVLLSAGALDAPKLTDFGIAKLLDRHSDRTRTGMLLGTPAYMAPEVVVNGPAAVTPAADVYGLGTILYECLTGRPPADGANTWATLWQVIQAAPAPPGRLRRNVARDLDAVCMKALAKDPAERYPSARALAEELDRLADGRAVLAPRRPRVRWGAVGRTARGAAVVLAAALLLFGAFEYRARWRDGAAAEQLGRDLLARGAHDEAERVLTLGLARVEPLPGTARLVRDLDRGVRESRRGRQASELHELVDRLRFSYDPSALAGPDLRTLTDACDALWLARPALAPPAGAELSPEAERRLRSDLLDLALLSADLRTHNGAGGAEAMRRLDEAEGFFGPDPALARLRAYYRDEPGWDRFAPADPTVTAWELYAVGRARLNAGALERAAELLRRAVEREPQGFWPHFHLAVCAHRLGRAEEAVAGFSACLSLAQNRRGLCHYHRGLAYAAIRKEGANENALRDFNRALELEPALAAAALHRGLLHHNAGRLPEAVADLELARRNGYPPAVVEYHLAGVSLASGDKSAALAHAERAHAADPTDDMALALLNRLRSGN